VLFQLYKHFHAKAVNNTTCIEYSKFNKLKFLAALRDIRTATFESHSILSAFQENSIALYNLQIVLTKVQDY
jgi:hypothetical protein